jgi:hypothetical protein
MGKNMADAPMRIVALVFTDIQGSTAIWEQDRAQAEHLVKAVSVARPARDPQIDSLRAACAARP